MAGAGVTFDLSNLDMDQVLQDSKSLPVGDVKRDDIISGRVITTTDEYVIIDLGSKSEGRIRLIEFDEAPPKDMLVESIVVGKDKDTGIVNLSKRELEKRRGWEIVREAHEKDVPVSGVVRRANAKGYTVNVEGLDLFLPHSQIGIISGAKRGKKPEIVGSEFTFRILELDQRRKSGVVSRKAFQDEQNGVLWEKIAQTIRIGDVVTGKVVKHTAIGAFVNVAGVEGLLHKSNISWERKNDKFRDKLPIESEIQVRVLEIDPENHRLSLGLKQMTDDPWTTVMEKFNVGDIVRGRVTYVANYGAFVEIAEGLEGLLHITEMSWTKKINHAQEVVRLDQDIETKIIGINAAEKRISLGLRQLFQNPWDVVQKEIRSGQVVKGKIKDVTNFGVFVTVTDDIDGLIRKEDLSWEEPAPDPRKNFKSGEELEFKILEVNSEDRRINCSLRHLLPNPYKKLKEKLPRGTVVNGEISGVVDFGIFIRFDEGYEGLAHISTMNKDQAANVKKSFNKGDKIQAVIKNIDPDNRKISLSLKDVDYAMERMEIQQYMSKEDPGAPVNNPFKNLRNQLN